jgi:hypothetical protein
MKQAEFEHALALIERLVQFTNSPQSVPFYRKAIRILGAGIVDEEFGELRYRVNRGEVKNPGKYFTTLLHKQLLSSEKLKPGYTGKTSLVLVAPRADFFNQSYQERTYHNGSSEDLFTELKPIVRPKTEVSETHAMEIAFSAKTLPWPTFLGPEFFTL